MTDKINAILEIRRALQILPGAKLKELQTYVRSLLTSAKDRPKIRSLEGIWEGVGFENIDLDAEVRALRAGTPHEIEDRFRRWNA